MEREVRLPPPSSDIKTWEKLLCTFIVLLQTLTAGSIFTFPIFGPAIASTLSLSMKQTTTIASLAVVAQYASAVGWGALADRRGPASASFGAGTFFVAGYLLMSSTLAEAKSPSGAISKNTWVWMALFYMLPGSATAASYFSAVRTSSKLYVSHPGLAIGVPCAIFGLSPLFLSSIGNAAFRRYRGPERDDTFDVVGYLWFLGALLGGVNFFGAVVLRIAGSGAGLAGRQVVKVPEPPEHSHPCEPTSGPDGFDQAPPNLSEETPLLAGQTRKNTYDDDASPHGSSSWKSFLTDHETYILGAVVFLCAGPGEMTMASLGAIVEALVDAPPTSTLDRPPSALVLRGTHVQVISAVNTVSRLLSGALSDHLSTHSGSGRDRWRISRLTLLGAAAALYAAVCFYMALGIRGTGGLWVLSIATGISYGAAFTLIPTIIAIAWPLGDLGRNWGLLSQFSAAGSFLYTLLFGVLFDLAASDDERQCAGRRCFEASFLLCAVSEIVAIGLVAVLWKRWKDKV